MHQERHPLAAVVIVSLLALGLIAVGVWEFIELGRWQADGGVHQTNAVIVMMYNVGGRVGVLLFFLLAAAGGFFGAYKTFVKQVRRR
jgi:hypothetical protein